ncbi:[RNA-polymerase]-subunit kinase protein [Dioscorea alata]|uniref:[RNA-polymerase]-subunit kinase protein n=1 Tax=Dioscorea alata TaxID=55571 RepID=A0ACB7UU10_DIOAL|nr:[RNA-polymerase]-subunit kinase protein [Dioscorea alata]
MEKYRLIKEIGDGTCGIVYKALDLQTNDVVAIKKMKRKYFFWEDCMNLREVKALRRLDHCNIVKLKEIVRENNELFIIFEYMECNLYEVMRERVTAFSEEEIRNLMSQMLQGLSYMHKNGFFHRDLKPENLLVTNGIIKIADFGLVRETMSKPPYTDYVSTRWYRAPEVLLQSSSYTSAIDMWAVGAILAELFTLSPLFPGESETDQLHKICAVLGTPDGSIWPEGMNFLRANHFNFFQELLFCSGFQGQCAQSFFWPLISPDRNAMNNAQVNPPVSSSYLTSSQAIQPSIGIPESSGYSFPQLQPKMFDFRPLLNISSPLQQRTFFD